MLALERDEANGQAINIGTGTPTSVLQCARLLLEKLAPGRLDDPAIQPKIVGRFRAGDIRHCYADIGKARRLLGYEPTVVYAQGLDELIAWVKTQQSVDHTERAFKELAARKLVS